MNLFCFVTSPNSSIFLFFWEGESPKRRVNNLETREKLGLNQLPKPDSRTNEPLPESADAYHKIEVWICDLKCSVFVFASISKNHVVSAVLTDGESKAGRWACRSKWSTRRTQEHGYWYGNWNRKVLFHISQLLYIHFLYEYSSMKLIYINENNLWFICK